MNQFLASLEITFRRDPTNYRPRVNKLNSVKDKEQKCARICFLSYSLCDLLRRSRWELLLPGRLVWILAVCFVTRCHLCPLENCEAP